MDSTASLYYPTGTTFVVDIHRNGVVLASGLPTTVEDGMHEVVIPFAATEYDADLMLDWKNGATMVRRTHEKVVTPIIPLHFIANSAVAKGETYTSEQIARIESLVRGVIESYTGQFFGLYAGTKEVKSSGDPYLALPMPLLERDSVFVNGSAMAEFGQPLRVTPDGWYLIRTHHYLEIKEAPPEEYVTYGVIWAPPRHGMGFQAGSYYRINGKWGYLSVPEAVTRAAELLVEDFMCNEVAYRDAYVNAVTSADWRADFHELKYAGTGNSRADLLLKPYINVSMVVI